MLSMSILTIFNINNVDGVVLVSFLFNCKHISNFFLIVGIEQANVCFVHIEKVNIFKDKIGHIMDYVLF